MLKIVVFDPGWGGELIGDFIEEELPVEVIRIIDFKHAPYADKSRAEILQLTDEAVRPWVNEVDVIVLASSEVALLTQEYLEQKYPEQKFVSYGRGLDELIGKIDKALILTTKGARKTKKYQEMKAGCQGSLLVEPDCDKWEELVDDGMMTDEIIKDTVRGFEGGTIVIHCAGFLDVEDNLKRIFRWRADVINFKKVMMRDLCAALELQGKDGRIRKEVFKYH